MADPKIVIITGASSGFGNLTARAMARTGHIVYAGMRNTADRNAPAVDDGGQILTADMLNGETK